MLIRALAFLAVSAVLVGGARTQAESDEGRMLIRNVAVSGQSIVFSYAGDLWRVGLDGGPAEPLTAGPEDDDFPVFSRDGSSIAFARRGADDWDVYVIPDDGGPASRLTYNPEADIPREWSATGDSVFFLSHRDEEQVFRLYSISRDGPFPTALPLPRAWDAALSPLDERIAYVPMARPGELFGSEWQHYRGGMTSRISIVNRGSGRIEMLTNEPVNDRDPMWVGTTIYFVSDRSGTFNIHGYDTQTREIDQLTEYETYGVESAAAGGGLIAFVQDGYIRTLDPVSGTIETPEIQVDPDGTELQPRTVDGASWIQSASLGVSGNPAAFAMRGNVVTLNTDTGEHQILTATSNAVERYPALSPDGQWIAYFSDESGDYQLRVQSLSDSGDVRVIPVELQPSFYRELVWSPDSKKAAFSDKELTLWVVSEETGGARKVTTSSHSFQGKYQPSWSPDGAWLAYSRYESNGLRVIYLYHVQTGRRTAVTSGQVNAEHPVFDKSGNYLYFVASNSAGLGEFGWSLMSGTLMRPHVTRRLNVAILREGMPSPVLPVTGQPNPEADSPSEVPAMLPPGREEGRGRGGPPSGARRAPQQGAANAMAGVRDRIVPLPAPPMDYADLVPGSPGVLYALVTEWAPSPGVGMSPSQSLYRYDLNEPQQIEKIIEKVDDYSVTLDGRRVLYRKDRDWAIVSTEKAAEPGEGVLDLQSIQLEVDPAAEWREIYHEAWRLMDDFFYDPDHHGQNLRALERHYATYLPSITRRHDLNLLIAKALGHISVSHLRVSGGDMPSRGEPSRIGLLGADYEIDEGYYRITRIYRSGQYNSGHPLLSAPLDQPGVYVREGDYLLAVDGQSISADQNLYSYFEGTALAPTKITVTSDLEEQRTRTYTVVPLPGENTLRRWNWAERNRRAIMDESQGILGYIFVPSFSSWGLEVVLQQLLANSDKRGLIIDQRFAPGGITSDYLIELLNREPLYYYMFRHGEDLAVPSNPLPEAKVLLINDVNGSAAETFALMFKLSNAGRIIGTRTMGAGIGPYAYIPPLIDGGRVSIPNRAAYNPVGSWDIENAGIEPDIEVEFGPEDWWEGRDPQLGTAIRAVLQMIVDNPPFEVKKPAYPVHGN